ncbi:hypothetical protein [Nevskia ramosa]|uniref:hypothetical protein n=1 Tax=Nevskia ramosa TaxID=64002 RepID=UPI003D0EE3FB
MSDTNAVPLARLVARLRELATAVTQGPAAIARECSMRVPAEPDRDADLVLSAAAGELERAGSWRTLALKYDAERMKYRDALIELGREEELGEGMRRVVYGHKAQAYAQGVLSPVAVAPPPTAAQVDEHLAALDDEALLTLLEAAYSDCYTAANSNPNSNWHAACFAATAACAQEASRRGLKLPATAAEPAQA